MSTPGSRQTSDDEAEVTAVVEGTESAAEDDLSPESRARWEAQRTARPRNKRRAPGQLVPTAAPSGPAEPSPAAEPETDRALSDEPGTDSSLSEPAASSDVIGTAGQTADPAEGSADPAEGSADPAEQTAGSVETPSPIETSSAGRAEAAVQAAEPAEASALSDTASGPAAEGAAVVEPGRVPEPAEVLEQVPSAAAPGTPERRRVRILTGVSVAAVLLVALTVIFGVAWNTERSTGPTANRAFVDAGATAEVVGQVTQEIVTVYSYNYTTLPQNEAAARAVITGRFAGQFEKVFGPVKQLAPQQQAVVQTTVPAAAVSLLQGDRARLLMMVNQTGTRGPDKQPTGASARLVVDAQKVDGQWKISEVTPE